MKINLRESLNKIDLATDNKYDLLNTFDSKKLSDNSKKKLVEAIDNNSIASINRVLHESSEQLYKVVISSGATKRNFESALYEDEAEGIVDYYGGRWIDENGFEWNMYVEEDDDSTEHAMVDDDYNIEDDNERAQREYVESLNESSEPTKEDWNDFYKLEKDISEIMHNLDSDQDDAQANMHHNDYDGSVKVTYRFVCSVDKKSSKKTIAKIEKALENYLENSKFNEYISIDIYPKKSDILPPNVEEYEITIEAETEPQEGFDESLTEASYGGAYDIEDDMFFTKEDIVEFADNICEYLGDVFGYQYAIDNVYMDGPRKLYINIYDNNYIEVESTFDIDMRKIRKPSDLFKFYGLDVENWFQKAFAREYRDAGLDESLKESIDISDYEELRYPLRDGDKYYQLYRKIENGKGVWAAAELDKYGSDVVGEPFKITYDQARGFEPIEDSSIRKLSRDLGKKLLPKRENLNEAYRPLAIGYMILKKEIPNHVNYAEFANYDEVVTAIPSEADVVVYPRGGKISGTDIAYWQFDAIDSEGKKTKANFSTYIYSLKDFLNNDEMELKLISDFKLIDEYPYLIEVDDDIEESLSLKESYIRDIIKLVRDSTNKYSSTYGKFTPARFDSYYINDLFDEFYKNGYSVSYNVLDYSKDYDDLSNQEYWFEKNESLTEDFDDEYETDFDDNEVEEGNHVFADGEEYVWVERIAGPIYLDFDKWAVWSARVFVDPRDFMTIHSDGKNYDFDGDAFKEKAMAAPIVYFVVEEDTGFIDWGPVESRIEAQDFLNGKQEDWDNDEYYGESLEKNLNEWYVHTLHYEDIGDGREYDYEVDHEEVLDYLSEIAIDEEDAPEDTEEYLKWVEDNFDELFNKYEYEIEEHFREDASQEEYDRRHSSYES